MNILVCLMLILGAGQTFAQQFALVPLGSVRGDTLFVFSSMQQDGGVLFNVVPFVRGAIMTVTFDIRGIYGSGFSGQSSVKIPESSQIYYGHWYLYFHPGSQDTVIAELTAYSGGDTTRMVLLGISQVQWWQIYSIDRTSFGPLAEGDTAGALVRLGNPTPDTEQVWLRFANPNDFTTIAQSSVPYQVPPGDTNFNLRVVYHARMEHPEITDTMFVDAQRIRNGSPHGPLNSYATALRGRCVDRFISEPVPFENLHDGDSSVRWIPVRNPTADTQFIALNASGSNAFSLTTQKVLAPKTEDSIRVVYTARRRYHQSLAQLHARATWSSWTTEPPMPAYDTLDLRGMCVDARYILDTSSRTYRCAPNEVIVDSIRIVNAIDTAIKIAAYLDGDGEMSLTQNSLNIILPAFGSKWVTLQFHPIAPGRYQAVFRVVDSLTQIVTNIIGIADEVGSVTEQKVIPSYTLNYASRSLSIEQEDVARVEVTDLLGRVVIAARPVSDRKVSLSRLSSGAYFLIISAQNRSTVVPLHWGY